MDLKKEIKLSDLVPRRKRKPGAAKVAAKPKSGRARSASSSASRSAPRSSPPRTSSTTARPSSSALRLPLERGVVVAGEVRDVPRSRGRSTSSSPTTSCRAAASGSGSPRTGSASGASTSTGSATSASSTTRSASAPTEAVAIPVDQAVLDYHVVGETDDEAGNVSRRILLAAAYRESIDRYVEACRVAKIELVGIDLEAFALLRAVAPPEQERTSPSPWSRSRWGTTAPRSPSRTARSASSRACSSGAARSSSPRSAFDLGLTPDEAHELLLEPRSERDGDSDTDSRQVSVRESIRRELQKLARELVASLQFYQSQAGSLAISQILVSGGASRLPGLPEELERLTRVASAARIRSPTCRRPTTSSRATTSPRSRSRSAWGWRSDARRQPASARRSARQRWAHGRPRGFGAARPLRRPASPPACSRCSSPVSPFHQRGIVDDRRVELQNVETRLVAAEARAAEVQAARAASNARLTAFQTVVAQRLAWEDVLRDLSRVLPPTSGCRA